MITSQWCLKLQFSREVTLTETRVLSSARAVFLIKFLNFNPLPILTKMQKTIYMYIQA